MSDEIPKWAKERAAALANGSRSAERPSRENLPSDCDAFPDMHAFARYIAAHEQPPVDPDVLFVRELMVTWMRTPDEYGNTGREQADQVERGERDSKPDFQAVLAFYRKHKEAGK